jgi:hypothetical protein
MLGAGVTATVADADFVLSAPDVAVIDTVILAETVLGPL